MHMLCAREGVHACWICACVGVRKCVCVGVYVGAYECVCACVGMYVHVEVSACMCVNECVCAGMSDHSQVCFLGCCGRQVLSPASHQPHWLVPQMLETIIGLLRTWPPAYLPGSWGRGWLCSPDRSWENGCLGGRTSGLRHLLHCQRPLKECRSGVAGDPHLSCAPPAEN